MADDLDYENGKWVHFKRLPIRCLQEGTSYVGGWKVEKLALDQNPRQIWLEKIGIDELEPGVPVEYDDVTIRVPVKTGTDELVYPFETKNYGKYITEIPPSIRRML